MNIDFRNTIFFSQMDLSEYYEDIKTKATVQRDVGDKMQKYYDNIKK
jgi:hypothetical protein